MKIGVFSDSLAKLSRREMFAWCAERGVTDVELGVGAWGPWPRPHLDLATIGERKEREILACELKEHGLRLAAVNGAGSPHSCRIAASASITSGQGISNLRRATATNSFNTCTLTAPPAASNRSAISARASSSAKA